MKRTLIIAEIGECFNGDMAMARRLISEANSAGCDFVKFQTLDYETISDDDPERDWFYKIALSPPMIEDLVQFAGNVGIQILFTPENKKTAEWLIDAGLRDVKIASNCLVNEELIKFVNRRFRRVMMSPGMASLVNQSNP